MEKREREVPAAEFVRACVNVEKFSACCRNCRNYSKTWSCPPFRFDPADVWGNYDTLLLQMRMLTVPGELREQVFSAEALRRAAAEFLRAEKEAMLLELLELEKAFPGSMALSAGSCQVCPEGTCARQTQEPCRNPNLMRYSIEALGGDVGKALELYFDKQLVWGRDGRMPEYYILLGGLLKKPNKPVQAKEMGYRVW